MNPRTRNILIGIDQFIYVIITLGNGMPDETMSSAAWRTEQDGKILGRVFRPIIDAIFGFLGEDDHCYLSYLSEKDRNHLPKGLK
jgi:hypothetical protein